MAFYGNRRNKSDNRSCVSEEKVIVIGVTLRVPHANFEMFRSETTTLVSASRAEQGVLAYSFAVDMLDPELIRVFEVYTDQAALDAHMRSPHFLAWKNMSANFARTERWLTDAALRD